MDQLPVTRFLDESLIDRSVTLQTSTLTHSTRPHLLSIFSTWLTFGIQSFGGGSSTFYLIHQACIDRGWIGEEEFVRSWALAQISPGINLLKLTVLLGYRLWGWPGMFAALGGLLLPSAMVTILMTAGFTLIRSVPIVQAALRGILPAAIGLSLAMAYQMAQPVLAKAYQEGPLRLSAHLLILAAAAYFMAQGAISPALVLLLAGLVAVPALAALPARASSRKASS